MKNRLQLLKPWFKSIKLIHVLLIILILVVFFGLFKREIFLWRVQNMPRVQYREITYKEECLKSVKNPEYEKVLQANYSDFLKKYPNAGDCDWNGKHDTLDVYLNCVENKSIKEAEYMSNKGIDKFIQEKETCDKTRNENWFWALGRYWFKVK